MGLSNDIISQFVKATKNEKSKSTEATVYGKVVSVQDNEYYVQLDGSDVRTRVSTTVRLKVEDRVIVKIKDHTATVTGNLTTQSASSTDVDEIMYDLTNVVQFDEFQAEKARIDSLIAEDVLIRNRLTAGEASISEIEADNLKINETLAAQDAVIKTLSSEKVDTDFLAANYATIEALNAVDTNVYNLTATYGDFVDLTTEHFTSIDAIVADLETNKLSATDADLRYANIDFTNIGDAAIEYLYAVSGLIENVIVSDGTITGVLAGVTINGDLIEGGTVIADKLVIKGDDGLYYKLNTDGVTTEAEQTEYNSLNGSVILAKSITATKISVDDLVAFDATIGGFNIGAESLYSGVKESIDNSTTGVFLGSDGQVAFGNADSYLKFYAVYEYYSVTPDAIAGTYIRGDTAIDMPVGTLIEGAYTTDGYRVYSRTDDSGLTTYFCRIPVDYKLAISADSILFGTDSKYSMDDVKQLTDHVKIGSHIDVETGEQLPCVELSEVDSSFKMRLTNKSATFADGVTDSTTIDSDGIETENLRVKNDIRHYDYVWRRRANGNLGLMWMEVTE